jgi:serpin B
MDAALANPPVNSASRVGSAIKIVIEPHAVLPLELNDSVQQKFARSHATFALNVYRRLAIDKPEGNFVFSPISLQLSLGILVVGARGSGENRLARVMAPGAKPEHIYEVMQSWQEQLLRSMNTPTLPGSERVGVLRFANSLWLDETMLPNSAFVDKSRQYFSLGVFRVPLHSATSTALGVLNQWASDQTDGRIVQMVKSLANTDTSVLPSAAYLRTKFVSPFGSTEPESFASKPGSKGTVDMLRNVLRTRAVQNLTYQAVELDLLYGATSLVSVMPMSGSIQSFVHGLTAQKWAQILKDLERNKRAVELHWPKLDLRSRYENLQVALGLPPGPIALPFISPNCQVATFTHEATFVANKDGIEVPSAAGTTMQSGSSSTAKDDGSLVMQFDRPFLFAVIHRLTGSILFAGQVTAP